MDLLVVHITYNHGLKVKTKFFIFDSIKIKKNIVYKCRFRIIAYTSMYIIKIIIHG